MLIEGRHDWETGRERESERAMLLLPQPGCFSSLLGSSLGDFLGCLSCLGSVRGRGSWEKRLLQSCAPHWSGSDSNAKEENE